MCGWSAPGPTEPVATTQRDATGLIFNKTPTGGHFILQRAQEKCALTHCLCACFVSLYHLSGRHSNNAIAITVRIQSQTSTNMLQNAQEENRDEKKSEEHQRRAYEQNYLRYPDKIFNQSVSVFCYIKRKGEVVRKVPPLFSKQVGSVTVCSKQNQVPASFGVWFKHLPIFVLCSLFSSSPTHMLYYVDPTQEVTKGLVSSLSQTPQA